MARITVGGTGEDWIMSTTTGLPVRAPSTLRWYTSKTGPQLTGLLYNGQTVNEIPVPATGYFPEHQWPDGVTVAWAAAVPDGDFTNAVRVKWDRTPPATGPDSDDLVRADNLDDIPDKAAARANLGVYSKTDVDTLLTDLAADLRAELSGGGGSGGTTTPTGMTAPAGASLVHDLTALTGWSFSEDATATVDQLTGPGPRGDVILRSTLIDGQRPSWGHVSTERSDLRGPDVPLGSVRRMIWDQRVNIMPDISGGGFFMLGPCEIHGRTLDQATVQPQIGTADWHPPGSIGRHIFEANGGSDTHDLYDVGPVDLGNWHQWMLVIRYTNATNGYCELWRDGVKVFSRYNYATTLENQSGYFKFPNYRSATINGTTQYDISGCRVYGA